MSAPSPHEAADALLTELLATDDVLAAARERAAEATGVLLRDQWVRLLARVDGPLPGWLAWRAAYGLHHLGHLRDAAAVADRADPDSDPGDLARLGGVQAAK